MFQRHDMMYNVYPSQNSASPNAGTSPYPVYSNTNANMYGNTAGMQGGPMMYVYGNAGGGTGGNFNHHDNAGAGGGGYGMRVDPAVAASYEYNGINSSMGGSRGRGGRGSYNGGPNPNSYNSNNNNNGNRRGGGGYYRGGGGGGPNPYDQQMPADYEVHDNQLKAPVAVTMETVVPTIGSTRLFSRPAKAIVYGSRSVVRICDAFQEGRCLAGDKCHDIHVRADFLADTRMQMSSWLMDRESEFRQALSTDPARTFRIFVADLKEVVEVPVTSLAFTKGLYVDPTTRAKRARGAGNHAHAHAVMQVPTSCGLYASDPAQCKWGRWCNQVHIDHQWMLSKKEEFDQWFSELQSRYFNLAPDNSFTVHDPQLKASISLPKFSIAGFSRGLFQGSLKKLASVCLLYQRGKCTAGSCCNQIHVVPQYLSLAREYAALEQSPDASVEDKLRVAHEMEMMREPCVEQQLREQQEAEKAMAELAASTRMSASDPLSDELSGHGSGHNAVEDELGSSGALFEHVQVDEDAEAVSHPVSANTSLTRRLNTSAPDINLSGGRHMNSDGSYSFNPYGSVASLPEASSSYGRAPAGRGNGITMESSGVVHYTPGNVQLLSTNAKGNRRLVAVVSPENNSSLGEMHRIEEMGTSSTAEGGNGQANMVDRHMYTPAMLRAGGGGAHRTAMHYHRLTNDGPFDDSSAQEHSSSLHPLDFDASLHFSPSPLLNFDASNTSLYRNASTREEELANSLHLRLAASNTSATHLGNSTNSHPYMTGMGQSSTGLNLSKNRFGTSAASTRARAPPSSALYPDAPAPAITCAHMSASTHSSPSVRPSAVGEGDCGH